MTRFPENPMLGSIFTGRLAFRRVDGKRVYSVRGFQDMYVKTEMGFRDLPCLSFNEIWAGNWYSYELTECDGTKYFCRALAKVDKPFFMYEEPRQQDLRAQNDYSVGERVIVIPGNIRKMGDERTGLFIDCHFPKRLGFIHFKQDAPNTLNSLLGKRICVEVDRVRLSGDKGVINTRYLGRAE